MGGLSGHKGYYMERYAGVMSGTSLDGVDVAIADIEFLPSTPNRPRASVNLIATNFTPYPANLRRLLQQIRSGEPNTIATICDMRVRLGQLYSAAVESASAEAGIAPSVLTAVGVHGQTVWHAPPSSQALVPSTLQLNSPAAIVERLGATVVSDFRSRDIAAGGEGAPLVPFADYVLLSSDNEPRCILNLGGMANLTFLPANGTLDHVLAFDTGPGNLLIDSLMQRLFSRAHDEGGMTARMGAVNPAVLSDLLKHPFFAKRPPKSSGAEMFGEPHALEALKRCPGIPPQDMVATFTQLTAESIALAINKWLPTPPKRVIAGGGGTRNPTIMAALASLVKCPVTTHEEFGIPSDFKEAIAFALLAAATLHGVPGNIPSATGASGYRVLGSITRP